MKKVKNSKKTLLRIAILLSLAGVFLTVTYGALIITSNSVHVDIQYEVELTHSVVDTEITLNAEVSNNGSPVGEGYIVDFSYSVDDGTTWVWIDSQPTDPAGFAQTIFVAPTNGGYDFQAVVAV